MTTLILVSGIFLAIIYAMTRAGTFSFDSTPTLSKEERYKQYINSEAWITRKDSFFATRERVCVGCDSRQNIHVHHMTYERLGAEKDEDLVVLCKECHELYHSRHPQPSVCTTREWLIERRIALEAVFLANKYSGLLKECSKKEINKMRKVSGDFSSTTISIVHSFVRSIAESENPHLSLQEINHLLTEPVYEWMRDYMMQKLGRAYLWQVLSKDYHNE